MTNPCRPPIQRTLFLFCAGNELFFMALYLMHFETTPINGYFPQIATWFLSFASYIPPDVISRTFILKVAAAISTLTYAQLMAIVTFPICFAKNVINIVQGWKASKILVGVDLAERAREREVLEMREE